MRRGLPAMARIWRCRATWRARVSGLARLYKRIHALLAGEQPLGPCTAAGPYRCRTDCWSVSSSGSWPDSFDSGWRSWVCAWRPCGVVGRWQCSPLATRRDTTRRRVSRRGRGMSWTRGFGVHVPPLRRRGGWRHGLKSAVRCGQSSLSETSPQQQMASRLAHC
jgi:hypothetical protein